MYDKLLPCPSSHRRVEGMNKNSGLFLAALPPGESLTRRSPRSGGMNVARRSTLGKRAGKNHRAGFTRLLSAALAMIEDAACQTDSRETWLFRRPAFQTYLQTGVRYADQGQAVSLSTLHYPQHILYGALKTRYLESPLHSGGRSLEPSFAARTRSHPTCRRFRRFGAGSKPGIHRSRDAGRYKAYPSSRSRNSSQ